MTDTTQAAGLTDEQKAFEAWCRQNRYDLSSEREQYCAVATRYFWMAWQGRAALAAQAVLAGWRPLNEAPHGQRVLLGPRHAPVVGVVEYSADWEDFVCTVVHYNGNKLVPGYRCSEWHALPAASPAPAEAPSTDIDEAALARMTEQGAKAWAGVDAQSLRDGSYAPAEAKEERVPLMPREDQCPYEFSEDVRAAVLGANATQPQAAQPVAGQHVGDITVRSTGEHRYHVEFESTDAMFALGLGVHPVYTAAPALTEEQIDRMLHKLDDRALAHGDDLPGLALNSRGLPGYRAIVRAALRSIQGGE